jgi:hypothetical protein
MVLLNNRMNLTNLTLKEMEMNSSEDALAAIAELEDEVK